MDSNHRLHLATRIHFGLLAHLGVAVSVEDLLSASPEGREALWVCEAMDDPELRALAMEFTGRTADMAVAPRPGAEVPALRHAVAPRAPLRAKPTTSTRAVPDWAPTAVHGEDAAPMASTPAPALAAAMPPEQLLAPPTVATPPKSAPLPRASAPGTAAAGHVAQPTAWSRDTSGFGFSRPQDLAEYEPPPFVTTADALRPSATPLDISWATALRTRPEPAERPGWKLAFWRKG